MKKGLMDYLEIMKITGVTELAPPVNIPPHAEPPTENNVPIPTETIITNAIPNKEILPNQSSFIESSTELSAKPSTQLSAESSVLVAGTKTERLQRLAQKVAECSLCQELAAARTQTVFGVGNPDAELLFLGEAPGADEDKKGEPFVGRAGQLLNDIIAKGMKMQRNDVYICNILRCRPPGNRNPLPAEAANCRLFLDGSLEIVQPKFICCLGTVAAQNLLKTDRTIGSMRGKVLNYNGIKVVCTYHPAYLLRNPSAKKDTWDDIKILMNEMGLPIQ
jgi:DNA polymerase